MLAYAVAREQFRQQLASVLPSELQWDRSALRLLARALLDILEKKYHHQHLPSPVLTPLVEQAIHEELTDLLLRWLKEARRESGKRETDKAQETIARVVSWAIFGTAIQWSQEETTVSSEEMADVISQVIMEGVARLAPDTLLE